MHCREEVTGAIVKAEGGLNVDKRYKIAVYLRTARPDLIIPAQISGTMLPQGMDAVPITLFRWPQGDIKGCDETIYETDYAYITDVAFKPYDLWEPGFDWRGQCKSLTCTFPIVPNGPINSLSGRFWVICDISLDCLNDTSICFVPAKGEGIDFRFRYTTTTGLNINSFVYFCVADREDNLVCKSQYILENPPIDPNDPNSDWPLRYFMDMTWDGRISCGLYTGFLADPEKSPYKAWVEASTDGPLLNTYATNQEPFFIAPAIDEIILTHSPEYPPPGPGQTTTLYAIIKGKINDGFLPEDNYRYYRGPGVEGPNVLSVWDGHTYRFNDLSTDDPHDERQQFYYEFNGANQLELREWNEAWWGLLRYTWYVYHDRRFQEDGSNQIAYDRIDTSYYANGWGHNWKAELSTPENWCHPDEIPYMRLLTGVGISDIRNSFMVQGKTSPKNESAHKVIFSDVLEAANFDIVEWAKTHIGVAYQLFDGTTKNPYRRIECSGLVTATRIQDIGSEQNQIYRIGHIIAKDYDNKYYNFGGIQISLGNERIGRENASRGSLITFRSKTDTTKVTHVVVVEYAIYDPIRHELSECYILHAPGWTRYRRNLHYGRVRYDDFITQYLVPDESDFAFFRWIQ